MDFFAAFLMIMPISFDGLSIMASHFSWYFLTAVVLLIVFFLTRFLNIVADKNLKNNTAMGNDIDHVAVFFCRLCVGDDVPTALKTSAVTDSMLRDFICGITGVDVPVSAFVFYFCAGVDRAHEHGYDDFDAIDFGLGWAEACSVLIHKTGQKCLPDR